MHQTDLSNTKSPKPHQLLVTKIEKKNFSQFGLVIAETTQPLGFVITQPIIFTAKVRCVCTTNDHKQPMTVTYFDVDVPGAIS